MQSCLCGEANCRGVLGPKPREVKAPKNDVKAAVKAGKRKLQELLGDDEADDGRANKRKVAQPAAKAKASLSSAGLKAARGAALALKKGVSTVSGGAKKGAAASGAKPAAARRPAVLVKKAGARKVVKTYGRAKPVASSRASSLTIVAMGDEGEESAKKPVPGKRSPSKKTNLAKKPSPAKKPRTIKTSPGRKTAAIKAAAGRNASAASPEVPKV